MKFIHSNLLLPYWNRQALFNKLDELNIIIKNYNYLNHLIKLLNYGYNDEEVIKYFTAYINAPTIVKTNHSLENYIILYGEEKGPSIYDEYKKHSSEALSKAGKNAYKAGKRKACFDHFFPQYWIDKGYSEEEAKEIVNKRKKKAKENSINAVQSGKRITCTQIDYYINQGKTELEAQIALAERQATCSLKAFQKKYGEEDGLKRYNERNRKWQESLNSKSSEEKQRIYDARIAGFAKAHINSISKQEIYILNLIENELNIKIERQFLIKYENKDYLFDGKYKNILIEYNGNYWHCNPKMYNESYYHDIVNKTAKEIWQYDEFKCNVVAKDYKVFTIWEDELNDTDSIINRFRLYL